MSSAVHEDIELRLADECSQFYDDPLGWVKWAFDWGYDELKGFNGPDQWQCDLLNDVTASVRHRKFDGVTPVDPLRIATASGHGIGKSAITAWLILWIMSTRPHAKGVVTANTSEQLKTKTWGELGKWRQRCIVGHWFEYNSGKGSMNLYHRSHEQSWRVDAQTCREENSESFAGLHAANSTPFYVFDEASAVPDSIWEVAEGGLTDGEPMIFAFGNPTRNTGKFRECFTRNKHRWITRQIDSRTAKMTNKNVIQQWIDDYGIDSDFVRVRVLGRFPRAGDLQYFDNDLVHAAMHRGPGRYIADEQLICSVDISRGGVDDTRIGFRRGYDAKSEKCYRMAGEDTRDSMKVVSKLTMVLDRHKPDVTFIDATGIGGPIGDRLRQLGYHVIDVHFGGNAENKKQFANKVTEMAYRCKEWMQAGGAIPNDPQLESELTSREYMHDGNDRLVLEPKKDQKKRIGVSPDWMDQLLLTFAMKLPPRPTPRGQLDRAIGVRNNDKSYNPMDKLEPLD